MIVSTFSVLSSVANPTRLALDGGTNYLFANTLCPSPYTVTVAFFGIWRECRGPPPPPRLVSCTVSPASRMNLSDPWHFPENVTGMLSASKWNAWVMVLSWISWVARYIHPECFSPIMQQADAVLKNKTKTKKKNSKLSLNNESRQTRAHTHRQHFFPRNAKLISKFKPNS